ncbi:hypothetical protein WMF38_25005 [Sorangium sp. So ce118]
MSLSLPPCGIDSGLVTYDANGRLKTLGWRGPTVGLEYDLPLRRPAWIATEPRGAALPRVASTTLLRDEPLRGARLVFSPTSAFAADLHDLNVRQVLLQIARDKGIPFIDLMASSAAWVDNIGGAQARAFYVDGDATHSNEEGARVFAELVVEGIRAQVPELAVRLRARR